MADDVVAEARTDTVDAESRELQEEFQYLDPAAAWSIAQRLVRLRAENATLTAGDGMSDRKRIIPTMDSGTTPQRDDTGITLREFVTDRINEDDAAARDNDGSGRRWTHDADVSGWWNDLRVLAECDAKRRVIEAECPAEWNTRDQSRAFGWDAAIEQVQRLLAVEYEDHPDYRQEWRPLMAATLRETTPRELIAEAKEFVWRKKLGNYGVREIAAQLSEHLGRPISKSTIHRWIAEGERNYLASTVHLVEQHRAIELAKLDERERRVQEVMDATHYALAGGTVVRGVPGEGQDVGEPLLDDEPVLKATAMKLKIMERRARYTGADAPTQITGDMTVNYRLVTDGQVDMEALT